MKKIKCQYCGRKYIPANERDCCPACGAFNEIVEVQNKTVNVTINGQQTKRRPWFLYGIFAVMGLPFIVFTFAFVIAFIQAMLGIDTDEDDIDINNDYEVIIDSDYEIPESQLETITIGGTSYIIAIGGELDWDSIDYDKEYTLNGSYDEMSEIANKMSHSQFAWLDTTISLNGKIVKNGATIYIDSIKLNWYGSDKLDLSIEIESNGKGTKPDEIEVYFVKGDIKDRIKGSSYGLTYKDNVAKVEDLFDNEISASSYWSANISNFIKYESIEFIIDGETFTFPLNYNDEKTEIVFYGLK